MELLNRDELLAHMCDFVHDDGVKDRPALSVGKGDLLVFQLEHIIEAARQ